MSSRSDLSASPSLRNSSPLENSSPSSSSLPLLQPVRLVGGVGPVVSASLTTVGDKVYAFGGFNQWSEDVYNSLQMLDLKTQTWSVPHTKFTKPTPRFAHTSNYFIDPKSKEPFLIIFGGTDTNDQCLNDIYLLNLNSMEWSVPSTSGMRPQRRSKHAATIYNSKLYVVGGVAHMSDTEPLVLSDVGILDLETWTWVENSLQFGQRYSHYCGCYENKLIVYGGFTQKMEPTNTVTYLNLDDRKVVSLDISVHSALPSHPTVPTFGSETSDMMVQRPPDGGAEDSGNEDEEETDFDEVEESASTTTHRIPHRSRQRNISTGSTSVPHYLQTDDVPHTQGIQFAHFVGSRLVVLFMQNILHSDGSLLSETMWSLNLKSWQWTNHGKIGPLYWNYPSSSSPRRRKPVSFQWHYFTAPTFPSSSPATFESPRCYLFGMPYPNHSPDGIEIDDYCSISLSINLEQFGIVDIPEPTLPNDLLSLLNDPSLPSDFTIICNPSSSSPSSSTSLQPSPQNSLKVHKLILSIRWPHFRNLISSSMLESSTSTLTIPEPFHVISGLISYLYTDSLSTLPISTVIDLLPLSQLYMLPRLRALCLATIYAHLENPEFVSQIYEKSKECGEVVVMQKAEEFIKKRFGVVVKTSGWRNLKRESLEDLWDGISKRARID
ncbi:hypothetical protein BKA69DRAFT_1126913 [Paraphysoderma sedebokerense]|nr:hypothetical protein BKA69DRAFT_1126913 [Paraphysoderma sedebokerense]